MLRYYFTCLFRVIWRDFSAMFLLYFPIIAHLLIFRNPSLYHRVISRSIVLFRFRNHVKIPSWSQPFGSLEAFASLAYVNLLVINTMAITWRFFALYTDPGRSTKLNFSSLSPAHSPRYVAACIQGTSRMCEHALPRLVPSYTTIFRRIAVFHFAASRYSYDNIMQRRHIN